MTPARLEQIGLALYGERWQSPLARALGMSGRHMRRLLAGDAAITEGIAADIRKLLARDEWIVGTDPEGERDYVVHTRWPRFVARAVNIDETGMAIDESADMLSGLTYAGEHSALCEIDWIDTPPMQALHDILKRGLDAFEIYTQDSLKDSRVRSRR